MQIAPLPPRTGRRWVIEGFTLLRRYPIQLMALTFLYLLILMLSTLLPLVGPFAPMALTPLFAIGMMRAAQAADQRDTPTPQMLFSGFRDDSGRAWKGLLMLGVANVASTLAALAFASIADGGTLLQIATGTIDPQDPALGEGSLVMASLLFLALYMPIQAALWYAPMFVAWHKVAPPKALFFSLVAVLRNKWVFAAYLLSWLFVAMCVSMMLQAIKLLLGGSPLLMSMVLSPLSLLVLCALYCSFWPSYRDVVLGD